VARVPTGLERLPGDLDITPAPRMNAVSAAQRDQQQTAAFHLSRARTLVAERKDREAQEALRRAIYLSPNEDEPHLLLGQLYRRAGRLADAIDEFKVAIWCRDTAPAQVALGDALLENGDRDGARRAATRALALAPGSAAAQALLTRTGN
jgi:Flp pilus assembly protein TadD